PMVLHWHLRNAAVMCLTGWVLLGASAMTLNSIFFGGDDVYAYWDGNILCDITTRVLLTCGMGIPLSILALSRSLSNIITSTNVRMPTAELRRHELVIELLISIALPLVFLVTYYVYQSHRYVLIQHTGCSFSVSYTWATLFMYLVWLPVIMVIACCYNIRTIYYCVRRQQEFRDLMRYGKSKLTILRFARLLLFCIVMIFTGVPIIMYISVYNFKLGFRAFKWSEVHDPATWYTIPRVPKASYMFTFYLYPITGFLLFIFFGIGQDAMRMYKGLLNKLG
ncbi:GPCR fungal pheromone mating factor, partial [Limtongia smithiae]|uniref:GPCR fungal pheromone mating factor n=1 Tax=Limtongia smithiae TaxID=1125753 RepID=UPI0034CE0C7B